MKRCSVKPYEGDDKYIFVSYCHKDKAKVFPIIEQLAKDGYRIWYDEGIDPGSEWPEIIAQHLNDCSAFLAFITENSLNSHNCRREISFALLKQKLFISVILEPVKMSPGIEMQLSATQSIFKYLLDNEYDFFKKIYNTKTLDICKGIPDASVIVSAEADYVGERIPDKVRDPFGDWWFEKNGGEPPHPESHYWVKGDDGLLREVYPYHEFQKEKEREEAERKAAEEERIKKEKEDAEKKRLAEEEKMRKENAQKLAEEKHRKEIEEAARKLLAEEKAHNDSEKKKSKKKKMPVIISLIAVLFIALISVVLFSGTDEDVNNPSQESSTSEPVEATESTTQTLSPSESESENTTVEGSSVDTNIVMSSNLDDFTFRIDDVVYQLPCAIENFTNNGWSYPEYFDDADNLLDNDNSSSTYLSKGSNVIDIDVFNYSGNRKSFKDCPIGRITYDFSGDIQIYLADKFLINGKSLDEVLAKYGNPYSNEDYDIYTEVVYEKTGADWIYERYTLRFNSETKLIEYINIVNFVKNETVQSDNSDTQYLSNYVAPNMLGEDPASFNVSIMGDIYNLPTPVQAFIDNGWEIVKTCDVGAGSSVDDTFKMRKNGVIATFGVYNFSDFQVDAKYATIYKINQDVVDNTDLDFVLPGNIKMGTSKLDAEMVLDNLSDFDKETDADSVSYTVNNRDYLIRIWIFEEKVASIGVFNKVCSYK